jgi:hypothetical protein
MTNIEYEIAVDMFARTLKSFLGDNASVQIFADGTCVLRVGDTSTHYQTSEEFSEQLGKAIEDKLGRSRKQ